MSNSTTTPAAFRKAVAVANETALRAGEFTNSITDGHALTSADFNEILDALGSVNTKRRTKLDESTRRFFFDAFGAFHAAQLAYTAGDLATAAVKLDEGATRLEGVEGHVAGLFRR